MTSMTLKLCFLSACCLASSAVFATVQCENNNQNGQLAPSTPTSDFIIGTNGSVTHTLTGLVWYRCLVGQTWNAGDERCDGTPEATPYGDMGDIIAQLDVAGSNQWRMPNLNELYSIIETSCYEPVLNSNLFAIRGLDYSQVERLQPMIWSTTTQPGSTHLPRHLKLATGDSSSSMYSTEKHSFIVREMD